MADDRFPDSNKATYTYGAPLCYATELVCFAPEAMSGTSFEKIIAAQRAKEVEAAVSKRKSFVESLGAEKGRTAADAALG